MVSANGYTEQAFVAESYDFVVPYRERPDVTFFVELARKAEGPVLELGCGTGRILLPTARAGSEIIGLDSSPPMLTVCRQKLAREPDQVRARVHLVEADMREFTLTKKFGLITLPFRSFQHLLTVADQLACLRCIHNHLQIDGKLVLDLFNPDLRRLSDECSLTEPTVEPEFILPDERRVVRSSRVVAHDPAQQCLEVEMTYQVTHSDGREERLRSLFSLRYFFRFEVEHLLARSGFEVEEVYSDYERSPYGSGHPGELVFLARRKSGANRRAL